MIVIFNGVYIATLTYPFITIYIMKSSKDKEAFEDTKGVIRIRISKNFRFI